VTSDRSVGNVLGTDDAHPLDFWVAIDPESYLQLDDIVAVTTDVPGREEIVSYGVVDMVRSRHEGTKFDSDVFHSDVIPMNVATAAHVSVTRVEPEIFVPPQPGQQAFRATGDERDKALYFDSMENKFAAGLSREGDVIWGNLEFLDGTRGAHVNISGISGVATKTSCAMFLLYSLFHSGALGMQGPNARAVIFNVKGEDLMFADKPNKRLTAEHEAQYAKLGLPAAPFDSVGLWSPASKDSAFEIVHSLGSRQEGVDAYCWSLREFCQGRLLRFLFADADSETSQLSYAVSVVERYLSSETYGQPTDRTWVELGRDAGRFPAPPGGRRQPRRPPHPQARFHGRREDAPHRLGRQPAQCHRHPQPARHRQALRRRRRPAPVARGQGQPRHPPPAGLRRPR
jgi:DNA helicase HerA-like ATPase